MTTPNIQLIPGAVPALFASATEHGCLTLADRYGLLAATLDESLTETERRAIDRLLRSVARGRIQICEQLSLV
jgi:hypothetical protein